jgi:hypothetical protein
VETRLASHFLDLARLHSSAVLLSIGIARDRFFCGVASAPDYLTANLGAGKRLGGKRGCRLVTQGQRTFRQDTFGDQTFWGNGDVSPHAREH